MKPAFPAAAEAARAYHDGERSDPVREALRRYAHHRGRSLRDLARGTADWAEVQARTDFPLCLAQVVFLAHATGALYGADGEPSSAAIALEGGRQAYRRVLVTPLCHGTDPVLAVPIRDNYESDVFFGYRFDAQWQWVTALGWVWASELRRADVGKGRDGIGGLYLVPRGRGRGLRLRAPGEALLSWWPAALERPALVGSHYA